MNGGPAAVLGKSVLALLAVLLVAANSLVFSTRVDLTEHRIHTIAPATRDVLRGLSDELTLTYYVSESLRNRYPQPVEIIDLLQEYAATAPGTIAVRIVDPGSFDDPSRVEAMGVVPQQLQAEEDGEQRFAIVYSGIVIEYLDRTESVPFVFSTSTLEYDLTSTVASLAEGRSPSLAFLLGDPAESVDGAYRIIANELASSYDIRSVAPAEPVPDGVDVVIVLDGGLLDAAAVTALEEYLDRGGAAMIGIDSVRVDISQGLSATPSTGAPILRFLAGRGIDVMPTLVLDESHNQILVEEVSGAFAVSRAYAYPHWPSTLAHYTDSEHPITARFPGLDLYWPTSLSVEPGAARIIVASTPRAWLMREPYVLSPQSPGELGRDASVTAGQYGFVAVAGARAPEARIAVVSDADFMRDTFIRATGSVGNAQFVANVAQWLSADEAMLDIRTRATRDLTLGAIEDPERRDAVELVARATNLVVVPALVALVGIVRLRRRRRTARSLERP